MARMFNPPHPGGVLKRLWLDPAGIGVQEFADGIGRERKSVSRILNEKVPISSDMAMRIARATGTTPESWLRMQIEHDLWNMRDIPDYKSIKSFAHAVA